MKINRISLTNVGIVRDLNIDCSDGVVLVTGANATGKSTICRAFDVMFEGGNNADLIGPNGDEYLIRMEFDNGEKYERVESRNGYTLKGWYPDGGTIKSPATTLKELLPRLSRKPTALVDVPDKDRVKFLHEAMPLDFTRDEVAAATKEPPSLFPATMDVNRLNSIRQGRYESRTKANAEWSALKATRRKWAESLPDGEPLKSSWTERADGPDGAAVQIPAPSDPMADVRKAEHDLECARVDLREALGKWEKVYRDEIYASGVAIQATLAEQTAARDAEIKAIEARYAAMADDTRKAHQEKRESIEADYQTFLANSRGPLDAAVEKAAGELAAAQERAAASAKLQGVRESIVDLDKEIVTAQEEAVRLDEAVKNLDELKRQKLETLPIQGVEVRDGQIFYNGLNFATQVNTAQQWILSCQVAALTLGDLKLMILDNTEALDEENRRAFIDGMKDAGIQVVMAAVHDGAPLEVATV
jgi:energy-coupling factor transporter ATP-binding protein EcfA2